MSFKLHLGSGQGEGHTHLAVWDGHFSLYPCPRSGVGGLGQVHPCLPPSQPVPPASHRDEDLQLQLALRLSQQEHEKVVGRASMLVLVLVLVEVLVLVQVLHGH